MGHSKSYSELLTSDKWRAKRKKLLKGIIINVNNVKTSILYPN